MFCHITAIYQILKCIALLNSGFRQGQMLLSRNLSKIEEPNMWLCLMLLILVQC